MLAVATGIYSMTSSNMWLGILLSVAGGLFSTIVLAAAVAGLFVWRLRQLERSDQPDDQDPPVAAVRAAAARENLPGCAQNHFMAVTLLKPGWFRKLTLALSLWGIRQLVGHAYRPGFVLNMGTIHYAKWFRLPKTDKLIFLSNFDGSWESYLDDFIMKAHPGQTAVWSHGVGFPKTRFLVNDGAKDGDRFKRWVRRQQVPTQFWYSRFTDLTTDQIRSNAVIHQGLARAHTDSAARSLLDCFGSMQQPRSAVETEEIQSLMFAGFAHLHYASYALVKLPDDATARAVWLDALVPQQHSAEGRRSTGPQNCEVTFGDHPFSANRKTGDQATFVAFSASGLRKLGLPDGAIDDGLSTFPSAFNFGMHNRGRILGDRHEEIPWRWSDVMREDDSTGSVPTADVIITVYAETPEQCRAALAIHDRLLGGQSFIDVIHSEPVEKTVPPDKRVFREHFGFRDGISQPVIRGTQRSVDGALARDTVEPGEFILGYTNNQGYNPPALRVSAATDLRDRLPSLLEGSSSPFPSFETQHSEARDFGRNGSFLVVRQLEQHVATFEDFTERTAAHLRSFTGLSKAAGANITADWVAAKMMGRWKDGAPLVLRPGPGRRRVHAENDFSFAQDDPQGLRCPFGAHIRRTNPRDGLQPDDHMQQAITNRHRLLRRGRPYEIPEDDAKAGDAKTEKGILFTCLCADLERQFEFVQQSWIGSSSFHGLTGEVDPVVGWPSQTSVFTIPTPSGPMTITGLQRFVTVRAGGYFFMPSRSAILYLRDRNGAHAAPAQTPATAPAPVAAPTPRSLSAATADAQGTYSRVDAK
jgi:Dyp-type peroxidase family